MTDRDQTPLGKTEFISGLEEVKQLKQTDFETYTIVKQRDSGQHYLRYSFFHLNIAEGGRKDEFDFFLPLSTDDVLGILLGDQPYDFPDHWRSVYLRSGTDDRLLPFDPSEQFASEAEREEGERLIAALLRYKREWSSTPDKEGLTRRLFDEIEQATRPKRG